MPSTIVAIWKSKGPTSHDVVDAVRRITGERRVGHAGTLDPLAEGVLVVGIGREATRHLKEIVGQEKEYVAYVRLGATSTTDDAEGQIQPHAGTNVQCPMTNDQTISNSQIPKFEDVERVVRTFTGHIEQIPPAYSAVKISGTPAYALARRGHAPVLKPRTVEIKTIDTIRYEWPNLELRVVCGPGTYIRALARDIGRALGVDGYLTRLMRTRVGTYTRDTALTIDRLRAQWPNVR